MRSVSEKRQTKETSIEMTLRTGEDNGGFTGGSGIGFFDHMLNSFCVHGGFTLGAQIKGDTGVDGHHTVEDTGIVLGKLFSEVIGDRSGIARFGSSYVPMDEALAFAAVDISGRPFIVFDADFTAPMIGDYDTQLTAEFFRALAFNMGVTLHLKVMYGSNDHHKTEALFKAAARAMAEAITAKGDGFLSAKGSL